MGSIKSKYPGFIDGLKSSNIATNITSLREYSEQIESLVKKILTTDGLSELEIDSLKKAESTIKRNQDYEGSPHDLIQSYIKFGDIFKSISYSLKTKCDRDNLKIIAKNYLLIAKYTRDTRIKNLAIDIAKDLE